MGTALFYCDQLMCKMLILLCCLNTLMTHQYTQTYYWPGVDSREDQLCEKIKNVSYVLVLSSRWKVRWGKRVGCGCRRAQRWRATPPHSLRVLFLQSLFNQNVRHNRVYIVQAWICANMRNGNWYCSGYFVLQTAFNNKKLRELGYPTFTEFYLKICEN